MIQKLIAGRAGLIGARAPHQGFYSNPASMKLYDEVSKPTFFGLALELRNRNIHLIDSFRPAEVP